MGSQPSRPIGHVANVKDAKAVSEKLNQGLIDSSHFEKACSLEGEMNPSIRLFHKPESLPLEVTQHWQADILKDSKNRWEIVLTAYIDQPVN